MEWYIKAQNTRQQSRLLSKESRETIQEKFHFHPDFLHLPVQENLNTLSLGSIVSFANKIRVSFFGGGMLSAHETWQ